MGGKRPRILRLRVGDSARLRRGVHRRRAVHRLLRRPADAQRGRREPRLRRPEGPDGPQRRPDRHLRRCAAPEGGQKFLEFVLRPEGQLLWMLPAGTPGGPRKFALERVAVLPSLYAGRRRRPSARRPTPSPSPPPPSTMPPRRTTGRSILPDYLRVAAVENDDGLGGPGRPSSTPACRRTWWRSSPPAGLGRRDDPAGPGGLDARPRARRRHPRAEGRTQLQEQRCAASDMETPERRPARTRTGEVAAGAARARRVPSGRASGRPALCHGDASLRRGRPVEMPQRVAAYTAR